MNKDMLKNGMMQMADYDCGGDDTTYNTGGFANTPTSGMCGMFDAAQMGGNGNGTCDQTEMMACRGYIATNLFPMFGMPADVATAMPVDGIQMMQLQAIREGATAAGCNPIYSFFGFPTAGRMTAPGSMTNGAGPTNGCVAEDFYSRDEIRKHYKKNLQQVQVAGANKVFGNIKVGPTFATYDIASKCITNPMTGATDTCTNGGYVATTVNEQKLLGYDTATLNKLMNLSNCTGCHTQTMATLNHAQGYSSYPANCSACHTAPCVRPTPTSACGSCHTIPLVTAKDARFTSGIHNATVMPNFTWSNGTGTYVIDFTSTSSNCAHPELGLRN